MILEVNVYRLPNTIAGLAEEVGFEPTDMGTKIPCLGPLGDSSILNIKALSESTLQYHAFWSQRYPEEAGRKDLGGNRAEEPERLRSNIFQGFAPERRGSSDLPSCMATLAPRARFPSARFFHLIKLKLLLTARSTPQNNLKCNPLQTALLCCLSCNLIGIIPCILILSCCR